MKREKTIDKGGGGGGGGEKEKGREEEDEENIFWNCCRTYPCLDAPKQLIRTMC